MAELGTSTTGCRGINGTYTVCPTFTLPSLLSTTTTTAPSVRGNSDLDLTSGRHNRDGIPCSDKLAFRDEDSLNLSGERHANAGLVEYRLGDFHIDFREINFGLGQRRRGFVLVRLFQFDI